GWAGGPGSTGVALHALAGEGRGAGLSPALRAVVALPARDELYQGVVLVYPHEGGLEQLVGRRTPSLGWGGDGREDYEPYCDRPPLLLAVHAHLPSRFSPNGVSGSVWRAPRSD